MITTAMFLIGWFLFLAAVVLWLSRFHIHGKH